MGDHLVNVGVRIKQWGAVWHQLIAPSGVYWPRMRRFGPASKTVQVSISSLSISLVSVCNDGGLRQKSLFAGVHGWTSVTAKSEGSRITLRPWGRQALVAALSDTEHGKARIFLFCVVVQALQSVPCIPDILD